MYHDLYNDSLPIGFSMSLAQNMAAFNRFSALSEKERANLVAQARGITSPTDMRIFVDNFANGKFI